MISGIYMIKSISKPNRFYIGSATNLDQRKRTHFSALKCNNHYSKKLQRHYNKYGKNDLEFITIQNCIKEDLLKFEQKYLDDQFGYFNTCRTAGNTLGVRPTIKTLRKLSESHLGQIAWNKGKSLSDKHKENLSKSHKGKKLSKEVCDKMSKSRSGEKHHYFGKKFSEEHKRKLSQNSARKGKVPWNKGLKKIKNEHDPE